MTNPSPDYRSSRVNELVTALTHTADSYGADRAITMLINADAHVAAQMAVGQHFTNNSADLHDSECMFAGILAHMITDQHDADELHNTQLPRIREYGSVVRGQSQRIDALTKEITTLRQERDNYHQAYSDERLAHCKLRQLYMNFRGAVSNALDHTRRHDQE